MIVGIDLGTTNSLIGVIEKGKPRLFKGEDGRTLVPSVVTFDREGNPLVGAEAKAHRVSDPTNTIYSAKRFIGRGKADVAEWMNSLPFDFSPSDDHLVRFNVQGRAFTPIEISSIVLRKLKSLAESQAGEKITKAVITVPAYFNDAQRQATKFAGELAGLEVARIVNEPTAACLAYGLDKKTKGLIAVYDLGGGTFDISILRVADGVFEVLATNGDTALGGDDFDEAIAKALFPNFESLSKEERATLLVEAEQLKRELSTKEEAEFRGQTITRAQLEGWIQLVVERTLEPCRSCLQDAKLNPNQITDVLLVGGSTRVPLVRQLVKQTFHREPICTLDPDEVVAMGAAVQANILAGQMSGMLLLDVIPLSLGIETLGGVVSKIVHRNTTIPVSASETYSTSIDGQVTVSIHVLQGERELVKDNRSLARFQLKVPPLPAGVPKIEVEFIVDANGILNVRAMELRTGTTASVQVNPSYGLNDTEVEKMLMDAFENAEGDFNARFLAEARTEAEGLIRATHKGIERGRHLIDDSEVARIERVAKEVEKSLSLSDHQEIKKKIEELNAVTHPLAEKILNEAVGQAMKDKQI